jgi:Phytanoyl-CoA dioxygenase (PhyH)
VRVPDANLDEVRDHGFTIVEGFLAPDELRAAQQALWLHFPTPEDYFGAPPDHPRYTGDQFGGVEEFPYRSWDLNRLAFHPDLVDAAERYLGTDDLHLYKVELWAKYGGAADYDQPLHRDYGSHSLVVPRPDRRYQQLTTFIYLSDVTADDGPTRIVPFEDGKDVPFTPLYLDFGALAEREVPLVGPAGSLLVYRTDILHRGSNLTGPRSSRFSILADYQVRGTTWGGKMAWPKQSPQRWAKLLPQCTVRERDLFGFPRPGHDYWTEQTLADVALRYPGIDMQPYRGGAS